MLRDLKFGITAYFGLLFLKSLNSDFGLFSFVPHLHNYASGCEKFRKFWCVEFDHIAAKFGKTRFGLEIILLVRINKNRPISGRCIAVQTVFDHGHGKTSPRMLRSVCSASPITHSVEHVIIRTITSRFLLLIRNAGSQLEEIQMRFSRKPLPAPGPCRTIQTTRPPSCHIICGWFPEISHSRFPGIAIFLRLVVHSRTYKNWESNSWLSDGVLHPNTRTPKTVKRFFPDTLVRSLSNSQFTHFRYRDAAIKFF